MKTGLYKSHVTEKCLGMPACQDMSLRAEELNCVESSKLAVARKE
jgi:hypothetical protein